MDLSITDFDFLNSFDHLDSHSLDQYQKNTLDLFLLKINANEFDYASLKQNLLDPVVDFSLSRKVKEKYAGKHGTLFTKAKNKFIEYTRNTGELGELLLYCFLETHLNAPKILSKLELKTSTSHYVNGADGVHFLKLDDGNYQLIFGESKTMVELTSAITDAFKSVYMFKKGINKKGAKKSGLAYERGLISDHLEKETFSDEQRRFIEKIIYPTRDNNFEVDDAFGIFVGYQIFVAKEDKKLPNKIFREKIKKQVTEEIKNSFGHIIKKIAEYKLYGHNFYIYVLPFTELHKTRCSIQKDIFQ